MSKTRTPKPIVRVTRNGLTRCNSCQAFFKATPDAITAQTRCIFCGESIGESLKAPPPTGLTSLLRRGRGSVVAASLFGVTALTPACLDPASGTVGGVADAVTDTVSSADGSVDASPLDAAGTPDIPGTPDAGPPDVGLPDAEPQDVVGLPDNISVPAYGFPPPFDAVTFDVADDTSDARDTEVEVEVIEPAPPQDDYGLPPDWE